MPSSHGCLHTYQCEPYMCPLDINLWSLINMDVFTLYQYEPYTCHLDINMDVFTLYQCEPYMCFGYKHGCLHTLSMDVFTLYQPYTCVIWI